MTPTDEEIKALCERLRRIDHGNGYSHTKMRNPDGPEAADALEILIAQVAELQAQVEVQRECKDHARQECEAAEKRLAAVETSRDHAIHAAFAEERSSDHWRDRVDRLEAERDKAERKLVESRDKAATYLRHRDRLVSALREIKSLLEGPYSPGLRHITKKIDAALSGSDVKETAREDGE